MKRTGAVEFHNRETEDDSSVSNQFNEWLMLEEPDIPGFRVTHITSHATNDENEGRVETLFIIYEYEK
jgi:hypothetical protein